MYYASFNLAVCAILTPNRKVGDLELTYLLLETYWILYVELRCD